MKALGLVAKLSLIGEIRTLMKAGVLKTEAGIAFPLDRIADAVRKAVAPGKSGKVLLKIGA